MYQTIASKMGHLGAMLAAWGSAEKNSKGLLKGVRDQKLIDDVGRSCWFDIIEK